MGDLTPNLLLNTFYLPKRGRVAESFSDGMRLLGIYPGTIGSSMRRKVLRFSALRGLSITFGAMPFSCSALRELDTNNGTYRGPMFFEQFLSLIALNPAEQQNSELEYY